MSMGIKKVLLSLGLSAVVSAFGVSMENASPAPADDEARQECPEGQKCDRPAPDTKKARKQGEERTNNAAPEGREHSEAMNRAEGDESAPAPRDEQKQPKDPKKKPPKDGKPPKAAPAEE